MPNCYFRWEPGHKLSVSIVRQIDGMIFDFAAQAFVPMVTTLAATVQPTVPAFEGVGLWSGVYWINLPTPLPPAFADGDYTFVVHLASEITAGEPGVLDLMSKPCKGSTFSTFFPPALTAKFNITPTS